MMNSPIKPLPTVGMSATAACILAFGVSHAAEHTVKPSHFEQSITFKAVAIPLNSAPISVTPEAWSTFKIEKTLPQGALVKKGEKLIWIDTKDLDKAIEGATKDRSIQKLMLERAQQDLTDLVARKPISLADAKRKLERFQQDHEYYQHTLRPNIRDAALHKVKHMEDKLSYAEEELKQLQKMYNEDGLTEDTEEIILQRVKNSVITNKRQLKIAKEQSKHTAEIKIPRLDIDWKNNLKKEQLAYEASVKHTNRNLKIKQLEVDKRIKEDADKQERLENLIEDRKRMEIVSPIDGVVYLGEFKDGIWHAGNARKVLYKGGAIPPRMTVMSIVPQDAKFVFNAFLTESDKALFKQTQSALLKLKRSPLQAHAVEADEIALYPNLKHQWLTSFSPKENMPAGVITGSQGDITIITAVADNIISLPKQAVKTHLDGTYSVNIKMAEGEPKESKVTVGRASGGKLEIISGVEAGQVIITP